MSASTWILKIVPLQCRCQVRMAWTRHGRELAVVRRLGIHVLEHYGKRSSCGAALIHAAHKHRHILLDTRSRSLRPALATAQVKRKLLSGQLDARRHAVQHHSDKLAMRLTEYRYPEFSSKCVHNYLKSSDTYVLTNQCFTECTCSLLTARSFNNLLTYSVLTARLANMSLNCGKDFATHVSSSMVIGPSAPREATFRAMTMRWSW